MLRRMQSIDELREAVIAGNSGDCAQQLRLTERLGYEWAKAAARFTILREKRADLRIHVAYMYFVSEAVDNENCIETMVGVYWQPFWEMRTRFETEEGEPSEGEVFDAFHRWAKRRPGRIGALLGRIVECSASDDARLIAERLRRFWLRRKAWMRYERLRQRRVRDVVLRDGHDQINRDLSRLGKSESFALVEE